MKVPEEDREVRNTINLTIAEHAKAALVQSIGKVSVFYRPAVEPKIRLPR